MLQSFLRNRLEIAVSIKMRSNADILDETEHNHIRITLKLKTPISSPQKIRIATQYCVYD